MFYPAFILDGSVCREHAVTEAEHLFGLTPGATNVAKVTAAG